MKRTDKLPKYLFLFLFVSLFAFSGTFANYRNSISGSPNANVAVWSFKLDGNTASQISDVKMVGDTNVGGTNTQNLLPSSTGVLVFSFDTRGCETAVQYNLKFSNMQNRPANLHFYSSKECFLADEISFGVGISGTIPLKDVEKVTTLEMYWKWQSFTDDAHAIQDGLDGASVAGMAFDISLQGKQFSGVKAQELPLKAVSAKSLKTPSIDYVQPWSIAYFSKEQLKAYLSEISVLGYNQIILTELIEVEFDAYYQNPRTVVAYYNTAKTTNKVDFLKNMFEAMAEFNSANPTKSFSVYLSTAKELNWFNVSKNGYYSLGYLNALAAYEKEIMQELLANYSSYKNLIAGWYMWEEMHSISTSIYPVGYHKQIKDNWIAFVNQKITDIKAIDVSFNITLPYLMSPYTNHSSVFTKEMLDSQWLEFFEKVNFRNIDIFAPQDSFSWLDEGYESDFVARRSLDAYANGIKTAYADGKKGDNKPKFYINIELFKTETMNGMGVFAPVPTQRLIDQLNLANDFVMDYGVEKLCSFSYFHYYSTFSGVDNSYKDNYSKFLLKNSAV